jgi:hypothetical protein
MPKGMSDMDFKTLLASEIKDALSYIDSDIAPERTLNYQYFLGEMNDVPAIEGRSSVVVRVVADYIGFILPSLLRTMISGRKIIEYSAKGDMDEAAAKAATEYVNDVVLRLDNKIEQECYGWGFDGLVNKVGVMKVWWEEEKETEDFDLPGLDEMRLVMAVIQIEQQGLEIIAHEQDAVTGLHRIQARRIIDKSHVKFEVLPPEEFVISRDARSLEGARLKSHRSYKYVGELIAEGYPEEVVMKLPSYATTGGMNNEAQIRQPDINNFSSSTTDPMLKKVAVHSGTILCDKDGTGLKEWYFVAGGWESQIEVLECKPFEDECYFCDFCPIPLPHLFYGRCPADDLIEIQRVQTVLARQGLDNVYLTNAPQQEVLVNQIVGQRIEYVQNKSPGGIIPVTALGTVNNVTVPFMGDAGLNMMRYWDMQAENRTGASRNSLGLDPEVLQNQSATAAKLQDSSSKLKLETIARIWATGGMRKLGRAILRILKRRQDFVRIVRMNGQQTEINPQAWAELEDWDVTVNTGLGTGDRMKDVQALGLVIAKMEQVLQTTGPNNPVVSMPMLSDAYQDMAEALGMANPEKYFKSLPADWQAPPAPPQENPEVVKVKGQLAIQAQQAEFDRQQKREQAQLDAMLEQQSAQNKAEIEQIQAEADIATKERMAMIELGLKRAEHEQKLELAEREADLAEKIRVKQASKPKAPSTE